jgi:hypothetical protein
MLKWAKDGDVPIDRDALEFILCLLSSLVDETRAARGKYVDGVRELEGRGGKHLAALVWKRPVPEPVPQTLDEWAAALELPLMDVQSVADEARQITGLARHALGLWIDTEGRRNRRKYLRDVFGPSQPLPPAWREAVVVTFGPVPAAFRRLDLCAASHRRAVRVGDGRVWLERKDCESP